jgi:Fe-S cluster assembly ATPase SufC
MTQVEVQQMCEFLISLTDYLQGQNPVGVEKVARESLQFYVDTFVSKQVNYHDLNLNQKFVILDVMNTVTDIDNLSEKSRFLHSLLQTDFGILDHSRIQDILKLAASVKDDVKLIVELKHKLKEANLISRLTILINSVQ